MTFVAVYRNRHAEVLHALLSSARTSGYDIRLWALDDPHELLEQWTVSSGKGTKFAILNELLASSDPQSTVIVSDDDILFRRGDLPALVDVGRQAGFGLFQASHARLSHSTYALTRRRPLSHARETTYVEIGPLFVVASDWRREFLPFPDGIGMGWGLELAWHRTREKGCRIGIVDDVSVLHLEAPGKAYAAAGTEERQLQALMKEYGISTMADVQRRTATWPRWRARPPWTP